MAAKGASKKSKKGGKAKKSSKAAFKKQKASGATPDPADEAAARKRNPRAFVNATRGKTIKLNARKAERDQRRMHVPTVEPVNDEPPPFVVLVHGPPGVGKTTLIRCLVRHYTKHSLGEVRGPVTCVSGKARRLTFIECRQDLNAMIDAAKFADLVLLLIDASFGFEMETFEFLNLLQSHGFPKVMGVLTHLDGFTDAKRLKNTKKVLKHRFWAEIYQGAKLFYLSGIKNGRYLDREVLNLARFIAVTKFRPLTWRIAHPYLVADRFEDITPVDKLKADPKCDRDVAVFGYLRGCNLKPSTHMHVAGAGDYKMMALSGLPDPCPRPETLRRKALNDRQRLLYAPMADLGGLVYDKDAVYIDIPDWKVQFSGQGQPEGEGEAMVRQLQQTAQGVDEKLGTSQIQLFQGSAPVPSDFGGVLASAQNGQAGNAAAASTSSEEGEGSEEGSSSEDEDEEEEEEDEEEVGSSSGEEDGEDGSAAEDAIASTPGHERGGRRPMSSLRELDALSRPAAALEGDSSSGEGDGQPAMPSAAAPSQLAAAQSSDASEAGDEDVQEDDSDAEDAASQDSEDLGAGAAKWKAGMLERAQGLFRKRGRDLESIIYGQTAAIADPQSRAKGNAVDLASQQLDDESDGDGSEDDGEDIFKPRARDDDANAGSYDGIDALDCSRLLHDANTLAAWDDPEAQQSLRNRFVTGDWAAGKEREEARPGDDDEDEGSDIMGDFEDVETGQKFGADGDVATAAAMKAIDAAAAEEAAEQQRAADKAAKKAAFDADFDTGGKTGGDKKKRAPGEEGNDEDTYFDAMRAELLERAARTKAALDAMDPEKRLQMEGYRPGTYVRIHFAGMPCELVENFDPAQPLLVGGLGQGEERVGLMQLRVKRHRWFRKTLKTRDPLVFSAGWRRFQSIPVYCTEDQNQRLRSLKYTPDHMHCQAFIWGPLVTPNTGLIAVQSLAQNQAGWRISATGVVTLLDASPRVVKKLKLTGSPFRIHRHTAFVGGMFNSQLEVSKFEGASIRTVSGIRGIIKKALRPGVQGGKDGSFRATFEDKPLMSDIIFLRAWVGVDLPRFYNPVTNLLGPAALEPRAPKPLGKDAPKPDDDGGEAAGSIEAEAMPDQGQDAAGTGGGWVGMKTVAQLRRDLGVGPPRNPNSLYKPIDRVPRQFNPLKIPKGLQAALPFKSKPKDKAKQVKKTLEQRRAVVQGPEERKAVSLVQQLSAIRNQREVKRKQAQQKRNEGLQKRKAQEAEWRKDFNQQERKRRYVEQGKADKFKRQRQDARPSFDMPS